MIRILTKWCITALGLLLAAAIVPGIHVASFYTALVVAIVLGLVNLIVRPILFILTLPITILTLGLFIFILNGLLFWFVSTFVRGFSVDGLFPAILGALIVSLFSFFAHRVLYPVTP